MKKVIVAGSLNVDLTIEVDKMPVQGETIHGHDYFVNEGGKGGNQAIAAVKSAADTIFIGSVGKDVFGKQVLDSLEKFHISTRCIQIHEDVSTGTAMIIRENNDNRIILNPGANYAMKFEFAKEQLDKVASEGDIFITQFENDLDATFKLIEYAKSLKMKTILNPAPAAEVPMEVVEKVTYLTPNEHEAVLIFGNELSSEELLKKYAGKLLITQGSKGVSTCLETGEILTVPARPAKVVDTTGAGDTLNGAFSVQIANGADIKTALTFANTAASLSTEKFGAQTGMPTVSEVEKELQ